MADVFAVDIFVEEQTVRTDFLPFSVENSLSKPISPLCDCCFLPSTALSVKTPSSLV
jgi:hypothetical protein